ncbi:hypothetical protein X767_30105 [Mesorhizobium sp. LSJC264A00]|nr:hypothetical protein X767_30105 [Mesorhizobium sp. LSJC264A00]
MARGIGIGDEVAITATVRRRVDEDHVSVSIPSYNFPHSILDRTTKVKRGQQIELVGNVTYVDEEGGKVTIILDRRSRSTSTRSGWCRPMCRRSARSLCAIWPTRCP